MTGLREVVIRSAAGPAEFLAVRAFPSEAATAEFDEGPATTVELSCDGLHAQVILPTHVADAQQLGPLFHEIEREWRGWVGQKWAGQPGRDWLAVAATHDGLGHVDLEIHLATDWPIEARWSVRGTITIDVGSAPEIASKMDRWLSAIWPEDNARASRADDV